jgi:hypothetical protein
MATLDKDSGLTAERVRELLDYNKLTGRFTWLQDRGPVAAGTEAGSLDPDGYVVITIDGRSYRRGRIAWLHAKGVWPEQFIDHRNGITDDDRIANLRPATPAQNSCNTIMPNPHRAPGVDYHPRDSRLRPWRVRARINGRKTDIGRYATKHEAAAAYKAATRELHGRFAASKRPDEPKGYVSFPDCRLGTALAELALVDSTGAL